MLYARPGRLCFVMCNRLTPKKRRSGGGGGGGGGGGAAGGVVVGGRAGEFLSSAK